MSGHKFELAVYALVTFMAYLIFALSLLAVNMVKYAELKLGFSFLLIVSFIFMLYCLHNFNKELNNRTN